MVSFTLIKELTYKETRFYSTVFYQNIFIQNNIVKKIKISLNIQYFYDKLTLS